jgi:hypothetical protein
MLHVVVCWYKCVITFLSLTFFLDIFMQDDAQRYGPQELRNMKRMRVSISYLLYIVFLCLVTLECLLNY